jgi:hypothetical protein
VPDESVDEQPLCNIDRDRCPGRPITIAAATQYTDDYTRAKLIQVGDPTPTPNTTCHITVSGAAECTSHDSVGSGTGAQAQWVETTCTVSTSGGSCFALSCYNALPPGPFCSPI